MSSATPEGDSNSLVNLLGEHLSKKDTSKALEIIKKQESLKDVKDASWDIVRIVSDYLTDDNYRKSRTFFECCEEILEQVAKVALPEEALLEFLEQAEALNNDARFLAMLKPLQIVLHRLTKRKEQSLGWCLNTVKTHLKALPVPEDHNLEGKEKLLMDADPCVQRISHIYSRISPFYKPFVENLSLKSGSKIIREDDDIEKERQLLMCFLLHMLEKPVVHLDLECKQEVAKSSTRVSVEEIVMCLQGLVGDLLVFLDYSGPPDEPHGHFSDEDDVDVGWMGNGGLDNFLKVDRVPMLSMSMLYYLIFAEGIMLHTLPVVYDQMFVFRCCLHHSSVLLKHQEVTVLRKGLLLSQDIIKRFPDQKISSVELDFSVYSNFVQVLTYAMVYCGVEENRKLAGMIFKAFLFKFDTKGRYLLMCNMQKTVNHSGTLGYIITLLKDMIHRAITSESIPPYFTGKCLLDLVSGYCRLPHGAESDLMELADEIISALNLIRFLLLHDKANRTEIWDHVANFEKDYFLPLREGLRMSRAHYQLKMRELTEEQQRLGPRSKNQRSQVTITVGCQQLPDVPYDQKVFLINSALNAFDLMECLLSHINECIEVKSTN